MLFILTIVEVFMYRRLLFIAFLTAVNMNLCAMNMALEHQQISCQTCFEQAALTQKEFLVDFAIKSNDIYCTRTASRDIAETVFDIDSKTFLNGDIELLKVKDQTIGFFAIKVDDSKTEACELSHLFVKAGMQKQGFGSILLARAKEIARKKGFKRMTLISDPDAKEFYIKKGALFIGSDQNLLNPGVDVPLFEIDLH